MPQGFACNGSTDGHVLKLKQNFYGAKDAGRTWYEHLCSLLVKKLGFPNQV